MTDRLDAVVERLAAGLQPVRRLRSPWVRASAWLVAVAVLAAVLMAFADTGAALARLAALTDLRFAVIGAVVTAVLAAVAASQLSLPDRHGAWALLPVPGGVLWLGASGWGCLRPEVPGLAMAGMDESAECFGIIVGLSVPLSALLLVLLRRARPLRPGLVAVVGGLAVAAAAAALLTLFHPYDASWADLAVHVVAVGVVILANRALSRRVLA